MQHLRAAANRAIDAAMVEADPTLRDRWYARASALIGAMRCLADPRQD